MAYGADNAGALHVFDLLARAEDCERDISGTSIPRPRDSCGGAKRLVLSEIASYLFKSDASFGWQNERLSVVDLNTPISLVFSAV